MKFTFIEASYRKKVEDALAKAKEQDLVGRCIKHKK